MRGWRPGLGSLKVAEWIRGVVTAGAGDKTGTPLPQEGIQIELGLFAEGGDSRRWAPRLHEVNGSNGRWIRSASRSHLFLRLHGACRISGQGPRGAVHTIVL